MQFNHILLKKANAEIKTIEVNGKPYAQVSDRIQAFRRICPGGTISTEIVHYDGDAITMRATISDDEGNTISTGTAHEIRGASYINKTSFVENCETSAVGRALGFAGIGIDGSVASADEVANAFTKQTALTSLVTDKEIKRLSFLCSAKGKDPVKFFKVPIEELTGEMYLEAVKVLSQMPDAEADND